MADTPDDLREQEIRSIQTRLNTVWRDGISSTIEFLLRRIDLEAKKRQLAERAIIASTEDRDAPHKNPDDPKWITIRYGLEELSVEVANTWIAADYPEDMRSDRAQFRHAHVHATKTLGKIAALIDHQDHGRLFDLEARELRGELAKLLADLVRCTAKMAATAPLVHIHLWRAYIDRAKQLAKHWGY